MEISYDYPLYRPPSETFWIFLAEGDALNLSNDRLIQILDYVYMLNLQT
jgi:hypothetical protein